MIGKDGQPQERDLYTLLKCMTTAQTHKEHHQTSVITVNANNQNLIVPHTSPRTPRARILHASSSDMIRKSVYIFGGRSFANQVWVLNDLWEFTLVDMQWRCVETSNDLLPRCGASLTCRADTALVLFGGMAPSMKEYGDVQVLDMAMGKLKWERFFTANCPRRRSRHFACTMANGFDLLVFGGVSDGMLLGDCHVLTFATGAWREVLFLNGPPPTLASNVCLVRKTLYVLHDGGKFSSVSTQDFAEKNARGGVLWAVDGGPQPDLSLVRTDHTLTALGNRLLLLGGNKPVKVAKRRRLFDCLAEEAYHYSIGHGDWSSCTYPAEVCIRTCHSVSTLSDDCAFVFGGTASTELLCLCVRLNTSVNQCLQALQVQARDAARHQTAGNNFGISVIPFYDTKKYTYPCDFVVSVDMEFAMKAWLARARRRIALRMGITETCAKCEVGQANVQAFPCGHVFFCAECFFSGETLKICPACGKRVVRAMAVAALVKVEHQIMVTPSRRVSSADTRKMMTTPKRSSALQMLLPSMLGAMTLGSSSPVDQRAVERLRLPPPQVRRVSDRGRTSIWIHSSIKRVNTPLY